MWGDQKLLAGQVFTLLTWCSIKSLNTIVGVIFYGFLNLNRLEFQAFLFACRVLSVYWWAKVGFDFSTSPRFDEKTFRLNFSWPNAPVEVCISRSVLLLLLHHLLFNIQVFAPAALHLTLLHKKISDRKKLPAGVAMWHHGCSTAALTPTNPNPSL